MPMKAPLLIGRLLFGGYFLYSGINHFRERNKNMALLGGAVALMGVEGPWPASVPIAQPSAIERLRRFARLPLAA